MEQSEESLKDLVDEVLQCHARGEWANYRPKSERAVQLARKHGREDLESRMLGVFWGEAIVHVDGQFAEALEVTQVAADMARAQTDSTLLNTLLGNILVYHRWAGDMVTPVCEAMPSRLSSLRVTTFRLHVPIIVAGTFAGSAAEEQGITNYVLGSSFPRRRCIILCSSAPALTRVPLQKGLQWSDKIWDVSRGISLLEGALASCRLCSDVHTLRLIL